MPSPIHEPEPKITEIIITPVEQRLDMLERRVSELGKYIKDLEEWVELISGKVE